MSDDVPEYEWKSAMEIIAEYPDILDAFEIGWEFEGGAFRRLIDNGRE